MTTLKLVDTHNMVAFLAKPAESEGFEQIVDFLNAHTIKYALTINPTIYTSCIEQFWATIKVKTVNGEVQLQALVDGKKIIITESILRRDLQLEDAEGVDCLPNATIFEQLTLMGMVKNLDNAGKFLMYTRFVQVFVNQQLEGMPTHKRIYIAPSHTKKIFGNMRRAGKGFSGRETPLFPTMVVHNQEEMGEGSAMPTDPHHTPTIIQPSTSQPQKTQKPRRPKRKDTEVPQPSGPTTNVADEAVNEEMDDSLVRAATTTSLDAEQARDEGLGEKDASKQGRIADIDANEDIYLVNVQTDKDMFGVNDLDGDEVIVESIDVVKTVEETRSVVEEVTAITILVRAPTTTTTTTAITDVEITLAQALVELKNAKPKADKVVIQEPEQGTTTLTLTITTAATTIIAVSTDPEQKGLLFMNRRKHLHQQFLHNNHHKSRFRTRVKAKIDVDYQLAQRLQAQEQDELTDEEKARLFVQFLEQRRKHFAAKRAKEKRNRPPTRAQQRSIITELVEESSKKAKAEIAHESNDGDGVTIDVTPLSTKSPTIVDYKIYKEGKKIYFQIIKAYVKARFKKTEPMNYMDNFLLINLKTMFEPRVEDNNMLFYLLVEKMYPLTNHTLHQMFNDVKLQVDYECEMEFKLHRLVKKQLKEGYVPE
ncbi:hypothetical protein Tco_1467567 [Tanacetum coccineum]